MKTHSKDIKDLALLISLVGLGWSGSAAAQTAAEATTAGMNAGKNDQPQRSDWDWVPPDAVAASQAELARLTALPRASSPESDSIELAQSSPVAASSPDPVVGLSKSDWDWSPADSAGLVTAPVAVIDDEREARLEQLPSLAATAPKRFVVAERNGQVLVSRIEVDDEPPAVLARELPPPIVVAAAVAESPSAADDPTLKPLSDAPAVPAFHRIESTRHAALPIESPIRVLADAPRPEFPPRIAVATHVEKVLLSLASVRGIDSTPMELMALLPQDIAVSKVPGATTPEVPAKPPGEGWVAVDSHQLEKVRGGFSTPQLQISFGISRAVYINGNLVTTTSLNLSDVGKLSGGGVPAATSLPGSLALVQSGTGNSFLSMPTANGTVATVIQNTLNNQKIQTLTQINATVNSLQILKGMNLQQTLRSGVIDSLRH